MHKNKKKLIAREFLIFIGTIVVVFLISLFFNLLSVYSSNKEEKLEVLRFRLSANTTNIYDITKEGEFESKEDFISFVNNNSVKDIYSKIMVDAFSSLSEFKEFVIEWAKEKKTKESEKIIQIEKDIEDIQNSFYYELDNKFYISLAVIFFMLSFMLRYIYYAIKWSIKISKQEN